MKLKIKYILLAVVLPIIVLSWSGILRTLDLALYDLGFHLRPVEPVDERIVLVEWDEENLQLLEETTISDDTLAALIEKIQVQQPRLIAFDIFRDIPVVSPRLSDRENSQAYNRLQNLFRSAPNLFGIEKVVPPKTNPPKILKEQNQVGAIDLPSDRDSTIRRAYTFPQLTKEGKPGGIPYLSVGLATKYLEKQGWNSQMQDNNSLKLSHQQNSIVINPLKTFTGAYHDDKHGLDFLINWRKGEKLFKRISTAEVISNQVPPDLFFDRLVIIGNVSSDTADRHTLPLNRWRRTDKISPYGQETFGVEIVAQVASSIISAALDERSLMNTAPKWLEIVLFLASVGGIIKVIDRYRSFHENLYLAALTPALSITGILVLCSFTAHSLGFWLPVAWILVSVWIAYVAFTYYLEQERKRNKAIALEGFNENLLHSLRNIPENISQNQNAIQDHAREIEYCLMNYGELANEKGIEIIERAEAVYEAAVETETQNNRIRKYRRTSEQFLRYCFLNNQESERLLDINQIVKKIVGNFMVENETKTEISQRFSIIEKYDSRIDRLITSNSTKGVYISSAALEIVIENLLSNAIFAVNAKENNTTEQYLPTVGIQTKLINHNIKFVIEDNGVGIPQAYQRKIFLPFKSYRNDQTGQGIGLYLAKKIINFHRGTLKVVSVEGQGSKFVFILPIVVQRNHTRLLDNFLSFLRKH